MGAQADRCALVLQLDPISQLGKAGREIGKMTDESGAIGEDTNLEYLCYRPARSSQPQKTYSLVTEKKNLEERGNPINLSLPLTLSLLLTVRKFMFESKLCFLPVGWIVLFFGVSKTFFFHKM